MGRAENAPARAEPERASEPTDRSERRPRAGAPDTRHAVGEDAGRGETSTKERGRKGGERRERVARAWQRARWGGQGGKKLTFIHTGLSSCKTSS